MWEPFGESDEEALIDEVLQVLPHGVTETEGVELPVAVEVEVNVATVDALAVDVVELVEVPVQTEVAVAEPVCAEEAVTALLEVELQLLSPVTLGGAVAEPEEVEEGVQERSAVEPAAQSGAQPQGTQVALVDAPSAEEKAPAGQGVGFTEERGQ